MRALDKALPPTARGSDEEVGAFVLGLFGEQRKQSQAVLADALERGDKHQLSSKSGPKFAETTLTGQSGVSALSTVGLAASLAPPKPSIADIDAAFAGRDGKRFVKLAVVGGLCVVGALAVILFMSSAKPVEPAAAGKPAASAVAPPAAPSAAPATTEPAVNLDALPVERDPRAGSSAATEATSPASRRPVGGGPRAMPVPAAPVKSATPAATVKPWKHDPGF